MSVVPRPFHNCRRIPVNNLVTIDGTPLPLAEISRRRSVVLAALDLDMSTPSAGQILSQLLLPVYGRTRKGGSCGGESGADVSPTVTNDLHELLLCCDTFMIIIAKEPLHQCRELQRELAVAGESFSQSGAAPTTAGTAAQGLLPSRETSTLAGTHLLPGCLAVVHDEGAELLQSLQLVGLDGRTVPAVFRVACNPQLEGQPEGHADTAGELALHYRQFGLAHAGVQHWLEYATLPVLSVYTDHCYSKPSHRSDRLLFAFPCIPSRAWDCRYQLLVERAATERLAQSLLATVVRLSVHAACRLLSRDTYMRICM